MAFVPAVAANTTFVPFRPSATDHIRRLRPTTRRRRRVCACETIVNTEQENTSPNPSKTRSDETATSPFSVLLSAVTAAADTFAEAAYAPVSSCSVLARRWEQLDGNFVLRPPANITTTAVLHFLGGAFVGAAPHHSYRSLLERLSARGYVIVATPYDLSLNYLALTSGIADAWERIETTLALDYGALPVVGLGHSAGALFHTLTSTLFADTCAKAANILISFNNKAAADAIPLYAPVFAPAFAAAAATERILPTDIRNSIAGLPDAIEEALLSSDVTPRRIRDNLIPTLHESRRVLDQLAPLVREIGGAPREVTEEPITTGGAPPEFYPPPDEVRASVEMMYSASQTLVVRFENDAIDESAALEAMVRARALSGDGDSGINVTLVELPGSHVTPLAQDVPRPEESVLAAVAQSFFGAATTGGAGAVPIASVVSGVMQQVADAAGGKDMQRLEELVDEWIQAGIANGYL